MLDLYTSYASFRAAVFENPGFSWLSFCKRKKKKKSKHPKGLLIHKFLFKIFVTISQLFVTVIK